MTERPILRISLANFDERRDEIAHQLVTAAGTTGFFILCDQEYPTVADIERMFAISETFFALPADVKNKTPYSQNAGYEHRAQFRQSTGMLDEKESLQMQYHRMETFWPQDEDVGLAFREETARFFVKCHDISMKILSCFATAMGLDKDFFEAPHDITANNEESTLRLLRYFPRNVDKSVEKWGAGAHTDFDVLTLLFQKTGQTGLEVCPGREVHTSYASGDVWTPLPAQTGDMVVNIGDMLMSWSDDRFKSNFHRVRSPAYGGEASRYSIAYFNQPKRDVVIQGPAKKYPASTVDQFIQGYIERNFRASKQSRL